MGMLSGMIFFFFLLAFLLVYLLAFGSFLWEGCLVRIVSEHGNTRTQK